MLPTIERRGGQRKPLKTKALIAVDGGAPVWVRTVDLSANGVGIACAEPLPIGVPARIRFDLFFNEQARAIEARGTVAYCIFGGGEFKAGISFSQLDLAAMTLIAKYIK